MEDLYLKTKRQLLKMAVDSYDSIEAWTAFSVDWNVDLRSMRETLRAPQDRNRIQCNLELFVLWKRIDRLVVKNKIDEATALLSEGTGRDD